MTKKAPTKITISKKALANAEIARLEEELRRKNNELVLSKKAHLSEMNRAKAFQRHLADSRKVTDDLSAKVLTQTATIEALNLQNKILQSAKSAAERRYDEERQAHGLTDIDLKLRTQELTEAKRLLAANPFKSLWKVLTGN